MSIFGGGTVINMFPSCLQPVAGPIVALAGRKHFAICKKICLPIVKERLMNIKRANQVMNGSLR